LWLEELQIKLGICLQGAKLKIEELQGNLLEQSAI
jgi:hypothetical protein